MRAKGGRIRRDDGGRVEALTKLNQSMDMYKDAEKQATKTFSSKDLANARVAGQRVNIALDQDARTAVPGTAEKLTMYPKDQPEGFPTPRRGGGRIRRAMGGASSMPSLQSATPRPQQQTDDSGNDLETFGKNLMSLSKIFGKGSNKPSGSGGGGGNSGYVDTGTWDTAGQQKKSGGRLTAAQRQSLPRSSFALPGKGEGPRGAGSGSYPIPDKKHGRLALSMVAKHGSSAEKARVRAKVHAKYPDIGRGK